MNSSPSQTLEKFTASHPTKLESGSPTLDIEAESQPSPQTEHSPKEWLNAATAPNRELISGFGTPERPANSLTEWAIQGPYTIQTNGSLGQSIVDADGNTIAWATDVIIAQVICKLLNEHEEMLVAVSQDLKD